MTLIVLSNDVASARSLAPPGRRGPIGRDPSAGERGLPSEVEGVTGGDVNIGGT